MHATCTKIAPVFVLRYVKIKHHAQYLYQQKDAHNMATNNTETKTRVAAMMEKNDKMNIASVAGNFVFGHVKEMFAVMTYLLCWSRLGRDTFFAGPVVLYVVLLAYSAPVLNPLLFWALRLGPYMNNSVSTKSWTSDMFMKNESFQTGRFRMIASLFLIPGFQIIGVTLAALIRNSVISSYGIETLAPGGTGVASMMLYKDPTGTATSPAALSLFTLPMQINLPPSNMNMSQYNMNLSQNLPVSTCSRTTPYPYEKNDACVSGTDPWITYYVLEEAADTFFWCWVLFFLYEQGEYKLDQQKNNVDDNPTQSPGVLHALEISIAALGLNMMFPTAHHGWHITLYWHFLQIFSKVEWFTAQELNLRLVGGFIGFLGAMLCYYFLDIVQYMFKNRNPKSVFSNAKPNTWLYAKIDQRMPPLSRSVA